MIAVKVAGRDHIGENGGRGKGPAVRVHQHFRTFRGSQKKCRMPGPLYGYRPEFAGCRRAPKRPISDQFDLMTKKIGKTREEKEKTESN